MSYILDALRRADAERHRGQVPGLHAQPAAPARSAAPRRMAGWAWGVVAAVALSLVLGLAVWLWHAAPRLSPPPPAAAVPAPEMAAAPATPPGLALAQVLPAPVATTLPAPLPRVVSEPPEAAPPRPAEVPQTAAAASVTRVPVPLAAPVPTAPIAPIAQGSASPAPPRAVKLAELTAEQRRDLPPLVVGGSIWSEHAASRFVIFNGILAREGEAVAAGVVLERIGPKAAMLRWRGLLLELPL